MYVFTKSADVGTRRAAFWGWLFTHQKRGTPRPYIHEPMCGVPHQLMRSFSACEPNLPVRLRV